MKLDPRQLEILAAIAQAGGLTEGAAALGKSQPPLSRSVAALEARLGSPLFVPGHRPLMPTELGARLAEEGRKVLQAGEAASRLVQSFRAGKAEAVRVTDTPIFMDGVIVARIAGFRAQNPDIRIEHPDRTLGLLYARKTPLNPAARRLRGCILTQFETVSATIQHHERQSLWRR